MAKKISQLTQATEVKSDDVTVIVQDGETKKLPLNLMVTKQDIENKKVAGLAKLDEIEATYENDTYTPTITVKNKSSVKTGEGDEVDYSANVMDGHVKSAILKGQTIKVYQDNLFDGIVESGGLSINTGENDDRYPSRCRSANFIKVEPNSIITFARNLSAKDFHVVGYNENKEFVKGFTNVMRTDDLVGKINTTSDIYYVRFYDIEPTSNTEYGVFQGDVEPIYELLSVKMPVLKVTGKNLLNLSPDTLERLTINGITGEIIESNTRCTTKYIKATPKDNLFLKRFDTDYKIAVRYYHNDKLVNREFNNGGSFIKDGNIRVGSNANYNQIRLIFAKNDDSEVTTQEVSSQQIMLTSSRDDIFEPYKSNILTVNEEVELRGIGDVKDELNLLTGEISNNFNKITIDGTENWYKSSNETDLTVRYRCDNIGVSILKDNICICDSYNVGGNTVGDDLVVAFGGTMLTYRVLKSKFPTLKDFKKWLNDNPHTFIYQTEKSIKTVDLMPSGTHPSTTPYCWKNGHIQLSSSGLLPNLEYSVVTSRAGQINQNATMIVKNDKRIFDLEILLAGGLVNTTYQALTLQNQVETGLSKVSLSSETEPDYLLYHMIMKLIEEKAYKLDDLTEKVSIFYLYEKLSDEQFETIYSALYPFVEDEIVEEPVVEELPEVVEDEVIM